MGQDYKLMNQTISDIFVNNILNFSSQVFPDDGISHAKKCFLDYIGVTLAGAKEYRKEEISLLDSKMSFGGESTVIGHKVKAPLIIAALINGISSHAVELDDGQRFGHIHPGAPIISALLPVAEAYNLSMNDLYIGILTGYETVLRLASSVQPSHKLKGFHATGPCGTIGAAMGIAAMLKFDFSQFKSTLSAACTSASGILEMIEGNTQYMPYNSGKAASNGIVSAAAGKARFKYPADPLGGERGFLKCFSSDANVDILVDFTGQPYYQTNYFKLYAACGHCHSGIDAALELKNRNLFSIEDVKHIEVETYKMALRGHDHNVIDGVNSAKMSIPYSVAVALLKGSAFIDDYNELVIKDPTILDLSSKINVTENSFFSKQAPQKRIAMVKVFTNNDCFSVQIDYPKGQPENPLSLKDIEGKYYSLCEFAGLSESKAKRVANVVLYNNCSYPIRDLLKELC